MAVLVFFCFAFVTIIVRRFIGLTNITNPIIPLYYYHSVFFLLALFYKSRYHHLDISQQTTLLILYGYVALFSSAVLLSCLLGVKSGKVVASNFINNLSPKSSYLWAAFILQTIVLIVVLLFFLEKGVLIFGEDANNYRVEARKGLGFIFVIFRWVSEIFVVVCTLHMFTSRRNSRLQISLFIIYYLVTIMFMLGLGSRAFVLDLVIIVIAIGYWSKSKDIDFKLVLAGACFFGFLGLFGAFRQGLDTNFSLVYEKTIWRPFVNIQNFQRIVDDFSNFGYLYGNSILIELKTLLPGYQPNFGTWYKEEFGYLFSGGSITITYLGEAFLNFGYAGALFAPILVGSLIALVGKICQHKFTYFWVFISIMISLSAKGIISVGIGATLIGTIIPVFFCLTTFMMARYFLIMSYRRI